MLIGRLGRSLGALGMLATAMLILVASLATLTANICAHVACHSGNKAACVDLILSGADTR